MNKEMNKKLYSEFFKEESDDSITFLGKKMEVIFPEEYIDKNIATITNKTISMLGIFEGYIYENLEDSISEDSKYLYHFAIRCPTLITLIPPLIEIFDKTVENLDTGEMFKQKHYKLVFYYGDRFIQNVNTVQSINTLKKFTDMLFSGHLPDLLSYENILYSWDLCNRSNVGDDLDVDLAMLALIIASITKCPDDLNIPFRLKYDKYYEQGIYNGKIIRIYDIPKYSSDFASLTGADAKRGITMSMKNRRVDKKSSELTAVEEIID